jgi:succinyl-diaminopimelate desuccinylase
LSLATSGRQLSPESGRDPAVALFRDLVRIDTVREKEGAVVSVVADRLNRVGVQSDLHQLAPGRAGLIARLDGTERDAPALCLTGHLDTVGLGARDWSHDPLGEHIEGDRNGAGGART